MRLVFPLAAMLAVLGVLVGGLLYSRSRRGAAAIDTTAETPSRNMLETGAAERSGVGRAGHRRNPPGGGPEHATDQPAPTAESDRDQQLAKLVDSGAAPAEFLTAMKAIDHQFRTLAADPKVDATVSPWRCYRAGCVSHLTHKDVISVELLARRFQGTQAFNDWAGGKFRSGPIARADGRIEITWIFHQPEGPAEFVQ